VANSYRFDTIIADRPLSNSGIVKSDFYNCFFLGYFKEVIFTGKLETCIFGANPNNEDDSNIGAIESLESCVFKGEVRDCGFYSTLEFVDFEGGLQSCNFFQHVKKLKFLRSNKGAVAYLKLVFNGDVENCEFSNCGDITFNPTRKLNGNIFEYLMDSDFKNVNFVGYTEFKSSINKVSFDDVRFSGYVSFGNLENFELIEFNDVTFERSAYFTDIKKFNHVDFDNVVFSKIVTFARSKEHLHNY
jgi:uncharacterized protein YjbI with pentapeptide repeats